MNSTFLKLNLKDLGRGVLVFFLSGLAGAVAAAINVGHLPAGPEWIFAAKTAGIGAVGYLIKNLFSSPSDDYSGFFKLNWRDIGKAVVMLFITSVITTVTEIIGSGSLPNWPQILVALKAGLVVAIGYVIKNVFTNSDGQPLKKE